MSDAQPRYDGPLPLDGALTRLSLVPYSEDAFTRDGPRADVEYRDLGLDAATGGTIGAKGGTLTIMAAAPKALFDKLHPVLFTLGDKLFHVGEEPGQGAAVKTVNQLLCGVHIAVAAEAFALAEKAGIDGKLALEILGGSAAGSWMLNNRGPRMFEEEPIVASAVDIFVKDLGIVVDAGRASKTPLPIASAALQMFLAASAMGLGAKDDSQVVEAYRHIAGLKK